MNSIENFKAGDLHSNPLKLKKFDCLKECKNCSVYSLCGGRCLYWRKAKLWPKEGNDLICNSIKFYINEIKKQIPLIEDLIVKRKIKIQQFFYEDYFGPEIIP
jgi:sulfatase maturation enzyme AslB (radical SAM superfamily)